MAILPLRKKKAPLTPEEIAQRVNRSLYYIERLEQEKDIGKLLLTCNKLLKNLEGIPAIQLNSNQLLTAESGNFKVVSDNNNS